MRLSTRVKGIEASPTLALDAKTKGLVAQGIDVVNFGVGEPDFDTPNNIKEAAIKGIREGFTKYTPSSGIQELREAIAAKFLRDNSLEYKASEILVSVGAKHSIYNAVMALCEEGDEVIIPSPYWVSYPEMVGLAGGVPIFLPAGLEEGFKITGDALRKACSPKTKLLIFNSPSNPTGAIYTKQEMEDIAEVCLEKGISVISDEIYEKLIYEGSHFSFAALALEVKDITITVNGVSKAYAMTGWRIGYAAGPQDVIKAMGNLQSHSTSNPASISQKAALEGLRGPQDSLEIMRLEFEKRRNFIAKGLDEMPGIKCLVPPGAFYVYPDVSQLLGKKVGGIVVETDSQLADVLLDKARIAVVPGNAFGTDGNLRFSYATSMERIEEGLKRLAKVLDTVE